MLSEPHYENDVFVDICFWCGRARCQRLHLLGVLQYRARLNKKAWGLLAGEGMLRCAVCEELYVPTHKRQPTCGQWSCRNTRAVDQRREWKIKHPQRYKSSKNIKPVNHRNQSPQDLLRLPSKKGAEVLLALKPEYMGPIEHWQKGHYLQNLKTMDQAEAWKKAREQTMDNVRKSRGKLYIG